MPLDYVVKQVVGSAAVIFCFFLLIRYFRKARS